MKVLFAASEAVPFFKTGGLADVLGSLPSALARSGAQVGVILPLYQAIEEDWRRQLTFLCHFQVTLAWRSVYCGLFSLELHGVTYFFVDNEYYFARPGLYGHYDDGERFAFFSRAVVEAIPRLPFVPDIVHCNDWQTALIPIYLKTDGDRAPMLRAIASVFTIHNVEYQGRFDREILEDVFGLSRSWYDGGTLEFYGSISLLKGAIVTADAVTTVSPTYAKELHYGHYAHGLEGVIAANDHKLQGILNGIDTERYNPMTDPALCAQYGPGDLSGKGQCKAYLQRTLGLKEDPHVPILACVSRLVPHKGFDLVSQVLWRLMEDHVQLVVLGQGDQQYEGMFLNAQAQFPGRAAARIGYNASLSSQIYGGADLFLMPSKSEPCGLSQMIAMRYGTVPIVRETGGLKDTVQPYIRETGEGIGFTFAHFSGEDMLYVIRQALSLYHNKAAFHPLVERGMTADFSWNASAGAYMDLYCRLKGQGN